MVFNILKRTTHLFFESVCPDTRLGKTKVWRIAGWEIFPCSVLFTALLVKLISIILHPIRQHPHPSLILIRNVNWISALNHQSSKFIIFASLPFLFFLSIPVSRYLPSCSPALFPSCQQPSLFICNKVRSEGESQRAKHYYLSCVTTIRMKTKRFGKCLLERSSLVHNISGVIPGWRREG